MQKTISEDHTPHDKNSCGKLNKENAQREKEKKIIDIDNEVKYCPACGKELHNKEHYKRDRRRQYPSYLVTCKANALVFAVEVQRRL